MKRTNLLRGFGAVGCLALAAAWGVLTFSGTALANPPDGNGNHNHGDGGGGGGEETIFFDVTTLVGSDIVIIGVFTDDVSEGTLISSTGCFVIEGPAEGRADKHQVIVNRPSPAIQMDFLAGLSCFMAADIYGLNCGGDLVIKQAKNGSESIEYFFQADGINGAVQAYRIDGDAMIVADNGGSFPKGDSGYTVFVDNIRVSQDTGPRRNACEGSFPDALAVIRLDRR